MAGTPISTKPVNEDPWYQAGWSDHGRRRNDTGVFWGDGSHLRLRIDATSGMVLRANTGALAIEGVDGNVGEAIDLDPLDAAHATLHRYDRIVGSLHKNAADPDAVPYSIELEVLKGTNAASDSAARSAMQSLRSSSTRVDVPIAYVHVGPTAVNITSADITMDRTWHALEKTSWMPYGVTPVVQSGSSFSIASQSFSGRYQIDGSSVHVWITGVLALTGSNPGGLRFPLPVASLFGVVPMTAKAFGGSQTAETIADPAGEPTGRYSYVNLYPNTEYPGGVATISNFPTSGGASPVNIFGTYERSR